MVKGYYTEEFLELCQKQSIYFDPATEDLETIQHHTVDFLGINQYYPKRVRALVINGMKRHLSILNDIMKSLIYLGRK